MQKRAINDVAVVFFAISLLTASSVAALHRSEQAQISRAGIPCHTAHCHAMNPGHWL